LTAVERPEAHDEEADLTVQWYPIAEAVQRVFTGEIVNSLAVSGILAAHAVSEGVAEPRPVDTPWIDRPTAFRTRKAAR
jgi:ADP-ribose pyrophosphatase